MVKAHPDEQDIDYFDVIPSLHAAVQRQEIFPSSMVVHPNGAGCRVIGDAIREHLQANGRELGDRDRDRAGR